MTDALVRAASACWPALARTLKDLEEAKADLPAPATEYGFPGIKLFLLILVCLICARTCAMAFNRIVDCKFDAKNPRTANRHLPAGEISLFSAWTLCGLSAVGFLVAAGFINTACLLLGPVAFFFVCFYSMTKRFTDYTHVWLNGNRVNSSTIVPPFTAIHAPMGASANATPSQTCV